MLEAFFLSNFLVILLLIIAISSISILFTTSQLNKTVISIIGIILIFTSVYYKGIADNNKKWEAKIQAMEVELADAKAKSNEVNIQIKEKIIIKTKYIKQRAKVIKEYINTSETIKVYDTNCPLPDELVKVHNDATIPSLGE